LKDAVTCCGYEASVIGYMCVQSVGEMKQQIHILLTVAFH